jgi:hypothetical protein
MTSHFLIKVRKCDFLGSRVLISSLENFNWGTYRFKWVLASTLKVLSVEIYSYDHLL